jgi:ethanolamine ammonia-lyase large subunit
MSNWSRREFIRQTYLSGLSIMALSACDFYFPQSNKELKQGVSLTLPKKGEDIFSYILRIKGQNDLNFYRQIIGAANEFKEGDQLIGVAADNQSSRNKARNLLSNTLIGDLVKNPLFEDDLYKLIRSTTAQDSKLSYWTMGELKHFILNEPEESIKSMMPGLTSDIIAFVVKLMSNDELIKIGQKVFNPLPRSRIGSKGYLSARIQPNSPTDDVEDIRWQVFSAWSYAVGDLILGTNPVSGSIDILSGVETELHDLIRTFDLQNILPHSVLTHIDIQSEIEEIQPGTTGIWFQSLAGTDLANLTFDVTIEKMFRHAAKRNGLFGLYAETGQGADFTNGHGEGFDMVVHEARKYGFLRALKQKITKGKSPENEPWVFFNDVAGFIGPEVFRTKEQLVRCCLEDTVMGKLHGITNGLDICSTLHMDVSLDDLDWCIDQIMPVNPAYLMALPTKNDPMLNYLTTAFNDHVRIREKFGYKVDDRMWDFFKELEIIGENNQPTQHFGDPIWVYLKYCRARNNSRSEEEIKREGRACIDRIQKKGVPIAEGYGDNPWDLKPELEKEVRRLYDDSKTCVWAEWSTGFLTGLPSAVPIMSSSENRRDYLYHPNSGEQLSESAKNTINEIGRSWGTSPPDLQIIVSDGLNALALMDEGHLIPYLNLLTQSLTGNGYQLSKQNIVITSGRVRAGYACGKLLFGTQTNSSVKKGIVHLIGERPGNGHHCFSAYLTVAPLSSWNKKALIDHNITKVVSGISDTTMVPELAVKETIRIVNSLFSD